MGACSCGSKGCDKPGKHPRTMHGYLDATTDPATIDRWWEQWPNANICISTGTVSGIVVLDVDPKNGGDDSLADLIAQHGPIPETAEVISGSLGRHIYFKLPAGTVIRRRLGVRPGIDILGDGGYVIAPPSVHISGRQYVWELEHDITETPLAEPPAWFLDLATQKPVTPPGETATEPAPELPPKIDKGKRHTAMTSLAGTLRRRGATEVEISEMISHVNERRCDPPIPEKDILHIAHSVVRYKPKESLDGELEKMKPEDVAALALQKIDGPLAGKDASEVLTILDASAEIRFSLAVLRSVNLSSFLRWFASLKPKGIALRVEQVLRQVDVPKSTNGQVVDAAKLRTEALAKMPRGASKPLIDVGEEDLQKHVSLSLDILRAANDQKIKALKFADSLFVRGDMLVRMSTASGVPVPMPATTEKVRKKLSECATYFQWRGSEECPIPVQEYPPIEVCQIIVHHHETTLPKLEGIYSHPVLVRDGETVRAITKEGYDQGALVLLHGFSGDGLPTVVSRDDAVASAKWLRTEVFCDFPFASLSELAHAYALMLLPFVRPIIRGCTPLHLVEASVPGAGKGKLVDACIHVSTGGKSRAIMPPAKDEDEWRKRVTTFLMGGTEIVSIDNIAGKLDSATLCCLLTTEMWSDRILGTTTQGTFKNHIVWTATANNATIDSDTARRILRIRLVPDQEDPSTRKDFRHPSLLKWIDENTGLCMHHAWAIVLGWAHAGCPVVDVPTMGSFESWSTVMGSILAFAGIDGFLSNRADVQDQSIGDSATLRALVATWWEQKQSSEVTSTDLLPIADEVDYVLHGDTDRARSVSLTRSVRRLRDRWVDGFLIRYLPQDHSVGRKKASFQLVQRSE